MKFTTKVAMFAKVMRRGPTVPGPMNVKAKHKPTLMGTLAMERWVGVSGSVDDRLKSLASLRAGSLVGCVW